MHLAVSVTCMAIYWPSPGFKGRTFKLCVLTRWDLISASAAPHCGGFSGEEEKYEGIPTGERLDYCETGESNYCPRSFKKMPHRRATDTEPMDRILL